MVDELSKWKIEMCNFSGQLKESLSSVLTEMASAKEAMKTTCKTLQLLRENFDPASGLKMGSPGRKSSTCSLTDITNTNQKLSEALSHRLLGYIPCHPAQCTDWQVLQSFSNAELIAIQFLQISGTDKFRKGPNEACSAVVGAAAAAGCQLFPNKICTPTSCCGQCTGEIYQL
ncbi:uncharacterized protein LOC135942254 [Cloeon dipterum]|uniref:uncharacterized protein LOC135942254 n=1 Tax=Cloeon dipterum TaxID=197152 RepID=UPI0032205186